MAQVPPPHGMSEVDYTVIEAAVTETVRGRWFLNEFARRNRTAELRQLLEAMGRIENVVAAGADGPCRRPIPPFACSCNGSRKLPVSSIPLSCDMREAGVDERFAAAVEKEGRAVSGMMRGPSLARPTAAPRKLEREVTSPLTPEPPCAPPIQSRPLRRAATRWLRRRLPPSRR